MKQRSRKFRRGIILILSMVMLLPAISGYAATQKQKAMNAYKKWLGQSKVSVLKKGQEIADYNGAYGGVEDKANYTPTKASKTEFAIAYIDNDNIPELIVRTKDKRYYSVLTYRKGKVVRLKGTQEDGTYDTVKGYYKKTGVFFDVRTADFGIDRRIYYKMNATKASDKLEIWINNKGSKPSKDYEYITSSGKTVSCNHSMFKEKLKNLTKGKKPTNIKYYKNTAKNRNKVLK